MVKRKLVVVNDSGPIRELNGICGPIVSPSNVTIAAIKKMVAAGRTVLECDPREPRNKYKRIQLTLENVTANNFGIPERLTAKERIDREIARLKPLAEEESLRVQKQREEEAKIQEAKEQPKEEPFRPDAGEASQEGSVAPTQTEEEVPDGPVQEETASGEISADQLLTNDVVVYGEETASAVETQEVTNVVTPETSPAVPPVVEAQVPVKATENQKGKDKGNNNKPGKHR